MALRPLARTTATPAPAPDDARPEHGALSRWQDRPPTTGAGARVPVVLAVGAVAVAASAGIIRSFLFGVSPLDAQTYLAVGLIISVITVLAAWLPARRASRVNPIVALRAE